MTLGICSNHVGRLWLKLRERREELGLRRRSPKKSDRSAEIFVATARPSACPSACPSAHLVSNRLSVASCST